MSRPAVAELQRVVSAKVEPSMAEMLEELARASDRSLSGEIRQALRAHLERAETQRSSS